MGKLGLHKKPGDMPGKQAVAAVGQCELMYIYDKLFAEYHHVTAQILLTRDVVDDAARKQNAQNTLCRLLDMGALPIVNENDCIATDEIQEECFGDNDILSAMTADIVDADLLIILSDVDGLYDSNPNENEDAILLRTVETIDSDILSSAGCSTSGLGTGGMVTKIGAAKYATDRGINTIIASGEDVKVIYDILEGNEIGTFFIKQDLQEVQDVKKSND